MCPVSESTEITDTLNRTVTLTTAAEPAEIPTPTKQDTPQKEEVTASLTTLHQPTTKPATRVSGTDNLAASQVSLSGREKTQEKREEKKREEREEEDSITEHITESMVQMPQIEMPPPKPPTQVPGTVT